MYWKVKAYSSLGYGPYSETRTIVTPNPPSVPSLSSPSGLITTDIPTFKWSAVTRASGYILQVAFKSDTSFSSPVINENISQNSYTPLNLLERNKAYIWRVRSYNSVPQYSSWSSARSFSVSVAAPELISPNNAASPDNLRPTFTWNQVDGASSYTIIVSKYSNFSYPSINTKTSNTSYTPLSDLPKNVKMYWKVKAYSSLGYGPYSETRTIVTPTSNPIL
jgi:hypothetical protein